MRGARPYFHPKSLVDDKKSVGRGTRVWAFAHVMKGALVGDDCNIGDHAFIENGAHVGNRVTIKNGVSVWQGVILEDDVFVGPNAVFTNDLFPVSRKAAKFLPTHVKRGTCVGANATLVCGITLGEYAFIGAGSTVTRDVPDHALVYGNPASVKSYLCRCRKKLTFSGGRASCMCGCRYAKDSRHKVRVVHDECGQAGH